MRITENDAHRNEQNDQCRYFFAPPPEGAEGAEAEGMEPALLVRELLAPLVPLDPPKADPE